MKILIIGSGRLGSGLARTLSQRGHKVTVVDRDAGKLENLGATFKGDIIQGVGFDRDILLKAGIERSDALAAVSDNDDANIITALLGRNIFRVPKVVARIFDPRQAEIYRRLGIQTITPIELGAAQIVDILTSSELDSVVKLGNGETDIVQVEVPHMLIGRPISELNRPGEISVVSITRHNKAFIPVQGTVFQEHDLIHLAVMSSAAHRLNSMLGLK